MRLSKPKACTIALLMLAGVLAAFEGRSADDDGKAAGPQVSAAQTAEPPVIRVQSNLVSVPVSVTDAAGHAVLNLGIDDFKIEENGRPEIPSRIAEPGETPLELALLLDVSGSVSPRFEFEREAAARFLQRVLRPEDTVTIFTIGPQPEILQPRTADLGTALRHLCAAVPTQGSTAFYDTVVMAAHLLRRTVTPGIRRVLVALSDGEDNNSESYTIADVLQQAQRADCIFYSINPAGPSIRLNKVSTDGQRNMQLLATQTGGNAFLPDGAEELDPMFLRIATELRAQYLLEYYSSDQQGDRSFRHIVVSIPTHPDLRVRARQGYYPAGG